MMYRTSKQTTTAVLFRPPCPVPPLTLCDGRRYDRLPGEEITLIELLAPMLTLDVLDDISLSEKPWGQIALAAGLLLPNYHFPLTRTEITVEQDHHLQLDEPVIFAMNHTDRYNYWPFQYRLWRSYGQYTTTWVKGKYYNSRPLREFMIKTNNLAVPSRGYLITADAADVLGHPPDDNTYRLIRDAIDAGIDDTRQLREQAAEQGVLSQIVPLLDTPRDMLGMRFEPHRHNYLEAMHRLFYEMMEKFVELNEQALDLDLNILVFPEGTRSIRLQDGKPGLAQMALRMKTPVIPVGCNGSDRVYPGDAPVARGGKIVYRIGRPLMPDGELAPYQIDERFTPFTDDAEDRYGDVFQSMTELLMDRINGLLDARHRRNDDAASSNGGSRRFL